jgi:hypothetical protein
MATASSDASLSAEATVRAFFDAVYRHRFNDAISLCDDEGLEIFRDDWLRIAYEAQKNTDSSALTQTLQQTSPGRELSLLSPREFLEFWMSWEIATRPTAYELFGRFETIGTVAEGENRAYVVYRYGSDAEIPLPVSLIAVSRSPAGWRIRLPESLIIPGYVTAVDVEL